jgi:FlaG/FlaF family flagellin (archaellin)
MSSERGDTNFISIIIIVAIVVALAGAFWTMANGGMQYIQSLFYSFLSQFTV